MGGVAGATLLASGTVQSDLEHVAVQPQDRIDIGFQDFGIDIDRDDREGVAVAGCGNGEICDHGAQKPNERIDGMKR
jgi:hypothetical protein